MPIFPLTSARIKYRTLIQCAAFDHIQDCFPYSVNLVRSLHKFLAQSRCALSIATFISKILEQ